MDSDRRETVLSARLCHFVTTQEPDAGGSLILRVEVRMLSNRGVKENHTPIVEYRAGDLNSGSGPEGNDPKSYTGNVVFSIYRNWSEIALEETKAKKNGDQERKVQSARWGPRKTVTENDGSGERGG